nr:MAG TPA: hypothetical protein [Caudoviricetes sp.]
MSSVVVSYKFVKNLSKKSECKCSIVCKPHG